jgi:AcrR family transcriptional regulator
MSTRKKRRYVSEARQQGAHQTRSRILEAAKLLFTRHGIDGVTVAQIADRAGVATPTVYAAFKSKEGMLRALMEAAMFGDQFEIARRRLEGVTDGVEMVALTATISRSVYEGESRELGMLRGASSFSPSLRKIEEQFEEMRLDMQRARLELLFSQGKARHGLSFDDARRIMWMYTSRDVYRMLVREAGWTPDRYEEWLRDTLLAALVDPSSSGKDAT